MGAGKKMSLIFGNSGPYLCITRYVDEQGISHLKLLPGIKIASHNLRACYLLPSLEKLKTKTVLIAEGGSFYERRCSIFTEAGHSIPMGRAIIFTSQI